MKRLTLLVLVLLSGCKTKANGKYCDTTCGDPSQICDQIKHECVPANSDLSMEMHVDDLSISGDLAGADLSMPDMKPAPACTMSATCPDGTPVCDSMTMTCRACSGASEDSVCAARSPATPHCKLSGTNAGICVACNVNADCPTATPTCNPDGSCRACAAHSDCDSGICDLYNAATMGQCVPVADIVYCDSSNDPGQGGCSETGKNGTQAHPYCLIADALSLIALQPQITYVHLAGSMNPYVQFEITSTATSLTFVGPGKDAMPPASVNAASGNNAIIVDPPSTSLASVTLDGLVVVGNGGASVVVCDGSSGGGSGSTASMTVVDSSFSGGSKNALLAVECGLTVRQSYLSNASTGLALNALTTYSVQNTFIYGNNTGVSFATTSGDFSFNTVAYNTGTIGIDCGGSGTVVIEDSIVTGNKTNAGSQFNNTSHCSLIYVVTGPDAIPSSGKITSPSPVPISGTNLRLDTTPGANLTANQGCCIDKIMNMPSPTPSPLPLVDIDGTTRPKGAAWDIGAHEAM